MPIAPDDENGAVDFKVKWKCSILFPANSINRLLGQTNVSYLRLELSDLSQVRSFVQQWNEKRYPSIQYLLLNAGLQFPGPVEYTADGYETTFATNHTGHALFGTHDPAQKTGLPDARYNTAEGLAHPTRESARFPGRQRYATSKLANVLWVYALHRRLVKLKDFKSWTVCASCPGLMPGTGLVRAGNAVERFLWHHVLPRIIPLLRLVLRSSNIQLPQVSGTALAYLATTEASSGVYYEGRKQIKSSDVGCDAAKQEDLWEWTWRREDNN
ncbi:hypothetical protein BO70DRAFT_374006 [Aspergillus heteromorphus CBS 117.55]|uniref:NAD(P)-binding protein n=1 Tax=Aspergillus heteromorphus CBS 117.55 TaxID=1448321 RepID=A0A317V9Z6_9EURO|nr:uncharacterized protein BO70DRAFT_374006 [Aspergillus heteromorphus CBS 117.55]PWY69692.1 hypothetical protein BO70DRAFT_374006 [Aspergillus heteromorphus CBS 117.55]